MSKETTVLFEVYRGKECLMYTNDLSAIYDKATLTAMSKDGHRFKLNGKAVTPAQVVEYVKENFKKSAH